MKTALLHYWLTNRRGGENVFREICAMFPGGDVFTHAYNPRAMAEWFGGRKITESFVGRLPFARTRCQIYLPLMPCASRSFDLSGYDLVVSSESGPVKGIRKPKGVPHVCYCHTPMRYLWDMYADYYKTAGLGGKLAMRLFRGYLRKEDLASAAAVDVFVANSDFVASRIKRIYGRDATVVHPMVDYDFFSAEPRADVREKGGYYLLAGQLIAYKRPDLAVSACLRSGRRLKVVGTGNQIASLQALAKGSPLVEFPGRVSREDLRRAYAGASALLFPGIEDFGIVPLEAQAAGTPVIAYAAGGARETVVDGETGLFFENQTPDALCAALEEFESRTWDPVACRRNAARFTPAVFRRKLGAVFARVCPDYPSLNHGATKGCACEARSEALTELLPPVGV